MGPRVIEGETTRKGCERVQTVEETLLCVKEECPTESSGDNATDKPITKYLHMFELLRIGIITVGHTAYTVRDWTEARDFLDDVFCNDDDYRERLHNAYVEGMLSMKLYDVEPMVSRHGDLL